MASDLREQSTEVAAEVESTERIMKIKVCECRTRRTIVLSVTEEQLKRITVLQLKKKIQSVFGIQGRITTISVTVNIKSSCCLFTSNYLLVGEI